MSPDPDQLVQVTVVVFKNKQYPPNALRLSEGVCHSSGDAVQLAMYSDNVHLSPWLETGMRKSVRRATTIGQFQRVCIELSQRPDFDQIGSFENNNFATVTLPIMTYAELPEIVAKTQVSGFASVRPGVSTVEPPASTAEACTILINEDLAMSAGKVAAQAAHAATIHVLDYASEPGDKVNSYTCAYRSAEELGKKASKGHDYIRDNGLTEIAPGSLTAVLA